MMMFPLKNDIFHADSIIDINDDRHSIFMEQ
jgi:hypothetical protein